MATSQENRMSIGTHLPQVEVDADVMGGTPVFAGSRLPIGTVLASLDAGVHLERLLESWPWLTQAHVAAARHYAAEHDIRVRPWPFGAFNASR
jgi:uncharacterized protein (DUF433 family)